MAIDLNNLAQLLQATNRLAEAEPLMRRALAIDEKSFGPESSQRRHRPQQPGAVASGHQPSCRGRAVDAPRAGHRREELRPGSSQSRHRPQQPGAVASGHQPAGRGRAVDAPRAGDRREELRSRASQRRHEPQQPGAAAAGHQPAGRGRAADAPRAGHRRARASAPIIPTSPSASTTWRSCFRPPTGLPRPSR